MIKNKIKNIRYFWIVNLFDLIRSFFNKKKRYYIFNFNFFFIFYDFLIIFDKKERKCFKIYFETYFDLLTIRNSFFLEEYNLFRISYLKKKLTNNLDKKLIIDCGANIGTSSIFFQKLFSNSKIITIESNEKNFSLLKKNCDNNFYNINCAIASDNFFYKDIEKLDNRGNTIQISDIPTQKRSVTINEIINLYKETDYNFFLIKIDIEGNEKDLFSKNTEWVNKFKIIIIELHDWMIPENQISSSFLRCISKLNEQSNCRRDLLIFGENLISIKN
jgi:FkbM family methyltransferase